MGQRLEQEERERERIEQELQCSEAHPASLAAREGAHLEGWQISPFYQPAREVVVTSTTSTSSLRVEWGLS